MSIDLSKLDTAPRLLLEARLKPLQGDRFQPTGFADLGPALYTLPNGTGMLLVESTQSVANRMELACCKDDKRRMLDDLCGLPYVSSRHNGELLTTSFLEAHRLSSPYLLNQDWARRLASEMSLRDNYQINDRVVTRTLFKYDPCSLLHGVWLGTKDYKAEFSGGRVRLVRTLSGFIEATQVALAESGGTKFDKNAARLTETGNAETGYGTLPFHRTEFTAEEIKAYFNIDLALLRGYGLGNNATKLLITLALFKVRRFLSTGLRLRTACDLEVVGDLAVTRPEGFLVPGEEVLLKECTALIAACKAEGLFADPPVTVVEWSPKTGKLAVELPRDTQAPQIPEELKKLIGWKKGTKKTAPKIEITDPADTGLIGRVKELFGGNATAIEAIEDALAKHFAANPEEDTEDQSDQENDG